MLDLLFVKSTGAQYHYSKELYDIEWSTLDKGGPYSLTAAIPIKLVSPRIDRLDAVYLYYQGDLVWLGRVRETPQVSQNKQAAIITCEGWIGHMLDESFQQMYSDTSYDAWTVTPTVAPDETWDWDFCEKDNNHRCFVRVKRGTATSSTMRSGLEYTRMDTGNINQNIYSVSFNYQTGVAYDGTKSRFRLTSYLTSMSGAATEWELTGSGALSGSVTTTITADKKVLTIGMHTIATQTETTTNNWGKITSVKIFSAPQFASSYYAGDVINDILDSFVPVASKDYSKISTGTYEIPEMFFEERIKSLNAIKELNQTEGFNYGFWDLGSDDLPRFTYEAHDKTAVHYVTSLRNAQPDLAGISIDEEFNSVIVSYKDARSGRSLFVERTAAEEFLDGAGITRSPEGALSVNTSSLALANRAGDTFLADKAKPQGKGSLVITGNVMTNEGRAIPAWLMKAGKNILIRDYLPDQQTLTDMRSSNVISRGRNIFRIVQTTANYAKKEVTLELDNEGDILGLYLARKRVT